MQYKWKSGYWALMIGSCLVQAASANVKAGGINAKGADGGLGAKMQSLCHFSGIDRVSIDALEGQLQQVERSGLLQRENTGEEGCVKVRRMDMGTEITVSPYGELEHFGFLAGADRALVYIRDGAVLRDSLIGAGDKTYILNDGTTGSPGVSSNNEVRDGGVLYVQKGGFSEGTVIKNGGIEIIEAGDAKQGSSLGAIVQKGGQQMVKEGGRSDGAKIYGGIQTVSGKGNVQGKEVESSANSAVIYSDEDGTLGQQQVYGGGIAANTKVMSGGLQTVNMGAANQAEESFVINTEIFGQGRQHIGKGGGALSVALSGAAVQVIHEGGYAVNVTIKDRAQSWLYKTAVLEGDTEVDNFGRVSIYAADEKNRAVAEHIALNGRNSTLFSVGTENDTNGSLVKKLSGIGEVQFISSGSDEHYSQLYVEDLSGNLHFVFRTDIAGDRGDYLFVDKGEGDHTISVSDSGAEITDPSKKSRDLITDKSGGADFTLTSLSGVKINAVDGGTYVYGLRQRKDQGGKIWYLSTDPVSDDPDHKPDLPVPDLVTTPSTDAVLSVATAAGLIFQNELQSLRTGRGILDKNKKNTALWARAIKNRERVATGHTHFKLGQTGVMFGFDQPRDLANGDFYVGGFTGYDQARITHERGGVSDMDVYSLGAYATYFDNKGWYLDGVVKYSYYQNDLRAISTNNLAVKADYSQWAVGGSLEAGYRFQVAKNTWVQPHGKLTGVHVEDQKIELSNGMTGDIDSYASLLSEMGVSVGRELIFGAGSSLTAYATASWLHEHVDDNRTVINKKNKFITDVSGDAAKLGVGFNGSVSDNLVLYAEASYLNGRKIKQSLQGILGVRYNF